MNRCCLTEMRRCLGLLALLLVVCAPTVNVRSAESGLKNASRGVTQIVAHRGASLERPECTLSAILRAIEVGASAVEVDVRTSKDGHLFLLHDKTLDRTTNGKGDPANLTLAELQQLDAGSFFDERYRGERIPSLIEAARACKGKVDLLLDLKEQGENYDSKVAGVIQGHGDPMRTIVGVRTVAQARHFRKLLPEARQLALIPGVDDIEAFAEAGVEFIRLWPRWLKENDQAVQRVRAAGKHLHLNGKTGSIEETLSLLVHQPESLLSDDPRRLVATLEKIATGNLPEKKIDQLLDMTKGGRVESGETGPGDLSFLNRDYRMMEVPDELVGLARLAFDGGSGARVVLEFRQPTVVFAVFDYNDGGSWSFGDGRSAKDHGWHQWREDVYCGSSNPDRDGEPNRADVWFREFKSGQALAGMPSWWLCMGIVDLDTARKIDGFREGLVTKTAPVIRRYSHVEDAAKIRPLKIPAFESVDSIRRWQQQQRKRFVENMIYPYSGKITVSAGESREMKGFRQEEFHVATGGERLFRYFRLTPLQGKETGKRRPAIVCFMGHGKVKQILEEESSYQHACAAYFARAGYVVFAMESVGMGPGADTHHDLDRSLRLEGRGWYSLLFAHQRILLDRVFADSGVDPERVGVAGVSTGGLLALSAAVMEPRIAAASVQGIFGSMRVSFIRDRDRHCGCGAIPGLLPEFDLPELALLVAPRPLHISNGEKDGFSPHEAERCLKLIEPIYKQAGGEKPFFTVPPGGHAFALKPAAKFFRKHLE